MAPRRLDVDLAKAIGIVAVVGIHSLRSYFSPDISSGEVRLAYALQFAVPGFFAASGVLAASAGPVPAALTHARLRRLLVPYAIASLAAQAFRASFGGESLALSNVLRDFVLGSSFGPYYYVLHAVLFVLAAPLLARLPARALGLVCAGALLVQLTAWVIPEIRFFAFHDPLHWLGFFLAGWWLRRNETRAGVWLAARRAFFVGVAGLGAALVSTHTLASSGPWRVGALQWLYVACVLVLLFAVGLGRETRARVVRFLSDASYTIYLYHLFFVLPVQRVLRPAAKDFDPVAIGVAFAVGLVGPLLLVLAGRALLGPRSRTLLGS